MPSIANATPQSRARELPDEFIVHQGQLYCKWCQKVLYSLRKDNIHEHLYSRVHQENRRNQGAQMTFDPDCPERMKRKAARKAAQRKRKQEKQMQELLAKEQQSSHGHHHHQQHDHDLSSEIEMYQDDEDNINESFDNLFGSDSDSDDSAFEGFPYLGDQTEIKQESTSSGLSRKASNRRITSTKARNMDYSWQDSQSSDEDEFYTYTSKTKMPGGNYEDSDDDEDDDVKPVGLTTETSAVYDFGDIQESGGDCEIVETEIVGVDEAEVVTWDSYLGGQKVEDSGGSNIELDSMIDDSSNQTTTTTTTQMTEEQHLAERVSRAREMAKSVKSTDFKKKINKKSSYTDDNRSELKKTSKKQKSQTGYMLWASKMRRHVSTKYPGLAFGEVSKKLGDMWKRCPDKEKQMWKFRSDKMAYELEVETTSQTTTKRKHGSRMIETGPPKKIKPATTSNSHHHHHNSQSHLNYTSSYGSNHGGGNSHHGSGNLIKSFGAMPPHRNPEQQLERELAKLPSPSIQPIDAAAHIHIMSEHLFKLGETVRATGEYDTSELINKTLDMLMCTIAPLLTLTKQVPGLEGCVTDKNLSSMYANIAHLMPTDS